MEGDPYIFKITPGEDQQGTPQGVLGRGKAWLDHTWNLNDGLTTIDFATAIANQKHTDIVYLEINNSYTLDGFEPRVNRIVVVQGPNTLISSDNNPPSLTDYQKKNSAGETLIWRYPLAYVTIYGSPRTIDGVTYAANMIYDRDIESRVQITNGTEETKYKTWTPLVTGATMDPTSYIPSAAEFEAAFEHDLTAKEAEFNTWFLDMKNTIIIDQSAQAALAQLNEKIDNKIIYGTTEPPSTLEEGQVYFQLEE